MTDERKPTIGRTVIFTPPHEDHPTANNGATEVPGVVTRVWGDKCINITVFADDRQPIPYTTANYSKNGDPGTWRWHDDVKEEAPQTTNAATPAADATQDNTGDNTGTNSTTQV